MDLTTSGSEVSAVDSNRFVMDYSLFRVAKQLRLLGYDVVCDPAVRKDQIIHLAVSEKRIVVTGSRHLTPSLDRLNRRAEQEASFKEKCNASNKHKKVVSYTSDGESEYESSNDEAEAPVRFVTVKSTDSHIASMRKIISTMNLVWDATRIFTRCVTCNLLIVPIDKSVADGLVHATVLRVYSNFFQCPCCKKVYWGVDKGVIVNYKALRTIEYLQTYCLGNPQGSDRNDGSKVSGGLQRHLLSYPRIVKTTVFSFLTEQDLEKVVAAFPMFKELVGIVLSGASTKFVHSSKKERLARGGGARNGDAPTDH